MEEASLSQVALATNKLSDDGRRRRGIDDGEHNSVVNSFVEDFWDDEKCSDSVTDEESATKRKQANRIHH